MSIASTVLTTVNAPYGAALTAGQLADKIASLDSVAEYDCSAFAFFTDVSPVQQHAFVEAMGLDAVMVAAVAKGFAELAGYDLALAA